MNTPCSLLIYDEVLIGIFATNSLNVSYTFVKMFTYIYYRGRESDSNENAKITSSIYISYNLLLEGSELE